MKFHLSCALCALLVSHLAIAAPVYVKCRPEGGGEAVPVMFDESSQSVRVRGRAARKVDISKAEIEFVAEDRSGRPATVRIDRKTGRMRAKQVGGEGVIDFTCQKE